MAQSEMQNVEGASLLSSLAAMFFKGLDNALTRAAEYEEEMGVLKQINRIPIESLDGSKTYTLTIKLSPVRGHDSFYFVEAETDAPELDLTPIQNKTMKIDNTTLKQFQKLIDKTIATSNYAADMNRDEAEEAEADVVGEPAEGEKDASQEGDITAEGAIDNLINSAEEWLTRRSVVAYKGSTLASINVEFAEPTDNDVTIKISATDALENKGQPIKSVKDADYTLNLVDTDGNIVSEEALLKALQGCIDDFVETNKMTGKQFINSSISATFIKDKDGVGLTAVKASDDIDQTMTIIYDLLDSEDFANSLEEGQETSFTITEEDEDYNIEPSDEEIDTSGACAQLYKLISKMYITLKSLEEMIGYKEFQNVPFFNALYNLMVEMQTEASIWVADTSNPIEILQDPFQLVPAFTDFRDYGEATQRITTDIDHIQAMLTADAQKLAETIQFLSVNAPADYQDKIDEFVNRLNEVGLTN